MNTCLNCEKEFETWLLKYECPACTGNGVVISEAICDECNGTGFQLLEEDSTCSRQCYDIFWCEE